MNFNLDFSYVSYEFLLDTLKKTGYIARLIGDSVEGKQLYLRHDVDTDYLGVLPLATIEHSLGMQSTWYFLPDCPVYNLFSAEVKNIIHKLDSMGHQLGLHIDASVYKDVDELKEALEYYFKTFSKILPFSKIFSFHRPAEWLLNDIAIYIYGWVNAYQKEFYSDVIYVSDSNRREFWKENRLSSAIEKNKSLTLLTHPLWWKEISYSSEEILIIAVKLSVLM